MDQLPPIIRTHFQSLDKEEQKEYLRSLSVGEAFYFYQHPELFLFDKQIIPDGLWRYCLLRCGRRFGKDIDVTTEIPTPQGWKTMADLQVGEEVFGEDGKPTTITYVSPVFHNPCYQLTFSTGETVIAGQDHQWLTHTRANRKSAGRSIHPSQPTVKTTKELFETQRHEDHESNHSIPISKPLQYHSPKPLPIDPYVLGCWLGDGSSATGNIECADQQILDEISKLYTISLITSSVGVSKSSSYRIGKLLDYQMPNGTPHKIGELTKSLQENNLLNNKHIPNVYLQSNIEQRMCLLQGLMDTDGCCDKRGVLEFCNTNKLLAEQTYELILSLGIKATIHQNESWLYDKRCADRYRIHFITDRPVFRLDRKRTRQRAPQNDRRYIIKIERVPTVPTKCISVDNASHLYLITKSCIPTHNSISGSAWIAMKVIAGAKSLGLCGEDYSAVSQVMVKNVISWFPPGEALYNAQQHKIVFTKLYKGAEIYCYSSDKEIKGPSLEYLWCDELANWCDRLPEKVRVRFDSVDTAVSVGTHPQTIITTTPRSFPIFWDYQLKLDAHDPNYIMLTGTMFDNPHLSEGYRQKELDKYKYDKMRLKQEIYGELVMSNPDALFQQEWIDKNRITAPNNSTKDHTKDIEYFFKQVMDQQIFLKRLAISVDPSGSNKKTSDEVGILFGAQGIDNQIYILYDFSGRLSPDQWAKTVRTCFYQYHKQFPKLPFHIICETNFGGDLVLANLMAADHNLRPYLKDVKAFKSKMLRAEPAASKYQRDKVHHIGYFSQLEREMTNYTGNADQQSPNHLDALAHMVNEFVVVPQFSQRDVRILNYM